MNIKSQELAQSLITLPYNTNVRIGQRCADDSIIHAEIGKIDISDHQVLFLFDAHAEPKLTDLVSPIPPASHVQQAIHTDENPFENLFEQTFEELRNIAYHMNVAFSLSSTGCLYQFSPSLNEIIKERVLKLLSHQGYTVKKQDKNAIIISW